MNYLLLNLAVADIIYSTFLMPTSILSYIFTHPEGMAGKVLCTLLTDGNFAWVGAETSTFTLVAISIERYFVVIFPHENKRKLTIRKLKVFILANTINVKLRFVINYSFKSEEYQISNFKKNAKLFL